MKQRVVVGLASLLLLTAVVGCAQTGGHMFPSGPASGAFPAGSVTDPERIRWAQRALQAAGFNLQAVNGTMAPQMVSAVQQFQRAKGLPATGYLDGPTEEALATAIGIARPGGRTN